jgi:thioredoxin-related protein
METAEEHIQSGIDGAEKGGHKELAAKLKVRATPQKPVMKK